MKKRMCFMFVYLILLFIVQTGSICAADVPEFTVEEFMERFEEAEIVAAMYAAPEVSTTSRLSAFINSLIGYDAYMYPTEMKTKDGVRMYRMAGGFSRPDMYRQFLRGFFSDNVIDNDLNTGMTVLDDENNIVYWLPAGCLQWGFLDYAADYSITEYTSERVVLHMVMPIDLPYDFSAEFDYVYERINGTWVFTSFKTRGMIFSYYMENDISEGSSSSTSVISEKSTTEKHSTISVAILTGVIFLILFKKKKMIDDKYKKLFYCFLLIFVSFVGAAACNKVTDESPHTTVPSVTAEKKDETAFTPDGIATQSPARHTETPDAGEVFIEDDWECRVVDSSSGKEKEIRLVNYRGSDSEIVVPDIVRGLKVTELSRYAFDESEGVLNITSIDLGEIAVGNGALKKLENLRTVIWDKNFSTYAEMCSGLFKSETDSRLKKLILNNNEIIPENAFKNAASIEEIVFKNPVIDIKDGAFNGCSSLKAIDLSSVMNIGDNAFKNCSAITVIDLGEVKKIGMEAFLGCSGLTDLVLPASLEEIGDNAFDSCDNISSLCIDANLSEKNGSVRLGSFPLLKEIELGEKVTRLPSSFFKSSKLAGNVVLKSSALTEIGDNAFYGNSGLESINIPNTVTSIGKMAFGYDMRLTEIILPAGLKELHEGAFYGCCALRSISIPDSVETLGAGVLGYCDRLTEVKIPDGITVLPAEMFYGCASLTTFTHTCTRVGDRAFALCTGLSFCDLGERVEYGNDVFYLCLTLNPGEKVVFPK